MVWSLEAGFEGAYEADCDMVDPCAHMEVVRVLATVEGEVVVHGYSGHGVSGYWTAIAVGALCARTLQSGTRPRAGLSRAWAAGWGREHSEGIPLHSVGTILLGSQGPPGSEIQGRGEEPNPPHFAQGRSGCDTEVVLKELGHCSRRGWRDVAYSWSTVLDCTPHWDRLTLPGDCMTPVR